MTSAISLLLYGAVLVVEVVRWQPSSAIVKPLLVVVLLAVAATPLGGGIVTLLAAGQDLWRRDRVAQTLIAAMIGLAWVVFGLAWLSWLAEPRGNPPGVHVG